MKTRGAIVDGPFLYRLLTQGFVVFRRRGERKDSCPLLSCEPRPVENCISSLLYNTMFSQRFVKLLGMRMTVFMSSPCCLVRFLSIILGAHSAICELLTI